MKFRKKPIVVEAYQLTEEKEIHTREGTVKGYPGDWIITGIQGEQYPCGKEIFEQTYEPADTRSRPAPSPCVQCLEEDRVSMMEHDAAIAAQAREDALEKGIAVIKNRIDCIMISYEGEENEAITQRPYAMSDGMQECILMLESLRTGGDE